MTTEKIFIGIDDQVIEATGEVRDALLAEIAEMKSKEAAAQAAMQSNALAKSALLERLGITAEEATLLVQ